MNLPKPIEEYETKSIEIQNSIQNKPSAGSERGVFAADQLSNRDKTNTQTLQMKRELVGESSKKEACNLHLNKHLSLIL